MKNKYRANFSKNFHSTTLQESLQRPPINLQHITCQLNRQSCILLQRLSNTMINISTSYACKIIIIINVVIIIKRNIKEQLASQFILLQVGSFTPKSLEKHYLKAITLKCISFTVSMIPSSTITESISLE